MFLNCTIPLSRGLQSLSEADSAAFCKVPHGKCMGTNTFFSDEFGGGEGQKLLPVLYLISLRPCFHRAPASNIVLEIILGFCMAMHRKMHPQGMEL